MLAKELPRRRKKKKKKGGAATTIKTRLAKRSKTSSPLQSVLLQHFNTMTSQMAETMVRGGSAIPLDTAHPSCLRVNLGILSIQMPLLLQKLRPQGHYIGHRTNQTPAMAPTFAKEKEHSFAKSTCIEAKWTKPWHTECSYGRACATGGPARSTKGPSCR